MVETRDESAHHAGLHHKSVIGVTGGIATGKSTVLAILRELGADTIDADTVYHELTSPLGNLVAPIVARFGSGVKAEDGSIDRTALGSIVFSDRAALADLERLTHPAVIAEIRRRILGSHSMVMAVDAVKLIESGMAEFCDAVWLIVAHPEVQRARLTARNGIGEREADRRIAAQPDEAPRRARADLVIDNSGDVEMLRRQVTAAWTLVPKLTF